MNYIYDVISSVQTSAAGDIQAYKAYLTELQSYIRSHCGERIRNIQSQLHSGFENWDRLNPLLKVKSNHGVRATYPKVAGVA